MIVLILILVVFKHNSVFTLQAKRVTEARLNDQNIKMESVNQVPTGNASPAVEGSQLNQLNSINYFPVTGNSSEDDSDEVRIFSASRARNSNSLLTSNVTRHVSNKEILLPANQKF